MLKIGVLVSGGGTNLQAIINNIKKGYINAEIVTVVSSRKDAFALKRAEENNIEAVCISRKSFDLLENYEKTLISYFESKNIDLIVLAGFMSILSKNFVRTFENKIINIHPSLIPSFCGKGYYGLKVHEAVIKRGVKVTGATVHFVNENADEGPIILQKPIEVYSSDTPEILQKRVMENAEWIILPEAIKLFCENKIVVENNITIIKEN